MRSGFIILGTIQQKERKFYNIGFMNWLQVSASTKRAEIDEGEGEEFKAKVMDLLGLKAQQQALEFILPGESPFHGEASFIQRGIKKPLPPPFGLLPIARILFDIGLQSRIEGRLAIGLTVKAGIQIEHGPVQLEPHFPGHPLQILEPLGQQHHIYFVYRSHRQRRQHMPVIVNQRERYSPAPQEI
jgi:hypothetical protein